MASAASVLGSVIGRPQPGRRRHHLRAGLDMAVMHRGPAHRIEAAAGQNTEAFAGKRRPRRRGADLRLGPPERARGEADRVGRRVPALRRPHAGGGIALDQLNVLEARGDAVLDVGDRQVFVEIDEVLALAMRIDRPWMRDGVGVRLGRARSLIASSDMRTHQRERRQD